MKFIIYIYKLLFPVYLSHFILKKTSAYTMGQTSSSTPTDSSPCSDNSGCSSNSSQSGQSNKSNSDCYITTPNSDCYITKPDPLATSDAMEKLYYLSECLSNMVDKLEDRTFKPTGGR